MTKHKNQDTANRMKQTAAHHVNSQERKALQDQENSGKQLTIRDIENILIDLALTATYNQGDKKEINFITDILVPNNINIPEGPAMETLWDRVTNSGVLKPGIGFGSSNKLTITAEGYQLMEEFGSYMNYLHAKQQAAQAQAQMMQNAQEKGNVMVVNEASKDILAKDKAKNISHRSANEDDFSNFE